LYQRSTASADPADWKTKISNKHKIRLVMAYLFRFSGI